MKQIVDISMTIHIEDQLREWIKLVANQIRNQHNHTFCMETRSVEPRRERSYLFIIHVLKSVLRRENPT